jgi:hypothetical protein
MNFIHALYLLKGAVECYSINNIFVTFQDDEFFAAVNIP